MLCEKNQQGINFQYHKWKRIKKNAEYVSMATKRGYLYDIFGGLN